MPFADIPPELVLAVCSQLPSEADRQCLRNTCRSLRRLLPPPPLIPHYIFREKKFSFLKYYSPPAFCEVHPHGSPECKPRLGEMRWMDYYGQKDFLTRLVRDMNADRAVELFLCMNCYRIKSAEKQYLTAFRPGEWLRSKYCLECTGQEYQPSYKDMLDMKAEKAEKREKVMTSSAMLFEEAERPSRKRDKCLVM